MENKLSDGLFFNSSNLEEKEDLSGRDRMFFNVLTSWGGYIIIVIIGFIIPRMIDRKIGQFSLGIWDFCWSLVNYLSYAGLGIGSSVNRYVAKYRAGQDTNSLCKAISSVICVQLALSALVGIGAITLAWIVPYYFSDRLGPEMNNARWVIACLGLSLAAGMAFDPFHGVITGCHRWDLHSGLNVLLRIIEFVGMFAVLLLGMGLRALGIVCLCAVLVAEIIRLLVAYRVCPELSIRFSYASWEEIKKMVFFGWKTVIATISPLILVQTASIFIVAFLGPAMLAVFSRPISLVRHVETFINRFSFIVTPTAGALQEKGQSAELRQVFFESVRFGVATVLPITLFFVFFGDIILRIWMGTKYSYGLVMAILAVGYFLPISQSAVLRILVGMNLHGRIGFYSFLVCIGAFLLGIAVVNVFGWTLINAALLIAVPLSLGNGIVVPVYACRQFGITFAEYMHHVFLTPVLCSLGLVFVSMASRAVFSENLYLSLGFGLVAGGLLITLLYWRFLLPDRYRVQISRAFARALQ